MRTRFTMSLTLAGALALSAVAGAQTTAAAASGKTPHTIVINLIERGGAMPYAFEPASFIAHHGDTLRFVQAASVMHDVHFKTTPKGSHLGGAATSQYLTVKGQTYVIVIDSRFADGKYEIVCDPHELTGMHAFLTVEPATSLAGGGER